jgi:hypothetical protein
VHELESDFDRHCTFIHSFIHSFIHRSILLGFSRAAARWLTNLRYPSSSSNTPEDYNASPSCIFAILMYLVLYNGAYTSLL